MSTTETETSASTGLPAASTTLSDTRLALAGLDERGRGLTATASALLLRGHAERERALDPAARGVRVRHDAVRRRAVRGKDRHGDPCREAVHALDAVLVDLAARDREMQPAAVLAALAPALGQEDESPGRVSRSEDLALLEDRDLRDVDDRSAGVFCGATTIDASAVVGFSNRSRSVMTASRRPDASTGIATSNRPSSPVVKRVSSLTGGSL